MTGTWQFACPNCGAPLLRTGPDSQRCPAEGRDYLCQDGIWRFLTPGRHAELEQFMDEYQAVRAAEGRGSSDTAYYRALPFADLSDRFPHDWKIRAAGYRALLARVVAPLARQAGRPLCVLDLGAGNGWLSYRLAHGGHRVAAIDLLTNAADGLGAYVNYDARFDPIQADFDRLPFTEAQADLVIFNASFHYAIGYMATLREALRVLQPSGQILILDSPVYRDPASGAQMVREREMQYLRQYGFASNAIPSQGYLTFRLLAELAAALQLDWRLFQVNYGLRWRLRPWRERLAGRREPAQFLLIVGRRRPGDQ